MPGKPDSVGSRDVGSRDVGSRDVGSRDVGSQSVGSQSVGSQSVGLTRDASGNRGAANNHGAANNRSGVKNSSASADADQLETVRPPPSGDSWSEPGAPTSASETGSGLAHTRTFPERGANGSPLDTYVDRRAAPRPAAHPPSLASSSHRWDDVTPRNSSSDLLTPSSARVEADVPSEPVKVTSFVVHPKPGVTPLSFPSWSDRGDPISSDLDSPRPAMFGQAPFGDASGDAVSASKAGRNAEPNDVPSTPGTRGRLGHPTAPSHVFPQSADVPSTDPTGGKSLVAPVRFGDTLPPRSSLIAPAAFEVAPSITTRGTDRAELGSLPKRSVRLGVVVGVVAAFLGPFLAASLLSSWLTESWRDVRRSVGSSRPEVLPTTSAPDAVRRNEQTPADVRRDARTQPLDPGIQDLDVEPHQKSQQASAAARVLSSVARLPPLLPPLPGSRRWWRRATLPVLHRWSLRTCTGLLPARTLELQRPSTVPQRLRRRRGSSP
jgi:hypothetical protein